MNENDSQNKIVIEYDANNCDIENHFHSKLVPPSNSDFVNPILNTELNNKFSHNNRQQKSLHKHNSKCFITEILIYGIKFILNRRVHNNISPKPVKRIESVSSNDDGYIDDGISSLQCSMGSDNCLRLLSGTSSEGYHEQEKTNKIDFHTDKIINNLSETLRLTLCDSCTSFPHFSDSFYRSLEHVLIFFQDRYHSCEWLGCSASQLTEAELSEARQELCKVYDAMFSEKINWGRIVAMIGFVGELSVCALSADRLELIEEYVSTSVTYVNQYLMGWITEHGGWEGLVDFQTGQAYDGNDLDSMFGNLSRLAGVAALALAGVVICKFVADHI